MQPVEVHGTRVYGVDVDGETRCAHYHAKEDVIAIRFFCCNRFYPCHLCHDAVANHPAEQWPRSQFDARAILCGSCGVTLSIGEYLCTTDALCPNCSAQFNPGCKTHRHLYFA